MNLVSNCRAFLLGQNYFIHKNRKTVRNIEENKNVLLINNNSYNFEKTVLSKRTKILQRAPFSDLYLKSDTNQ